MILAYGFLMGALFAWWARFVLDMYGRAHLLRRLSKWRAFPGWVDSIKSAEYKVK